MRKTLLLDIKKRNNRELVKLKMEKTFAYRRHEVVCDAPMVEAFMARWPALFDVHGDMDEEAINEAIEDTTVGIYLLKEQASADEQEDIGVVLEGIRVVKNLDNVAFAVVMLFGLMYTLNLAYPADLRYTFEVFQKVLVDLDGAKLSNKVLALKNRLFH
ncbi:unnamed protein product [Oreochromis niloticus]|nr:unnamed protein product [Mustela putorius furo]